MAVNFYSYEDADAPVLDKQAGSLVALLDAVLVNGYSSGATAKDGAGWEIAFSAADKRAYRSTAGDATGALMRVDDTESRQYYAYTRIRGYKSMVDIDNGSDPFPSLSQNADTGINKSGDDGKTIKWWAFADEKIFYLVTNMLDNNNDPENDVLIFGDIEPFADDDQNNCIIKVSEINTTSNDTSISYLRLSSPGGAPNLGDGIAVIMTSADGQTDSVAAGFVSLGGHGDIGSNTFSYPDIVTGNFMFSEVFAKEQNNGYYLRGKMPGMINPLSNLAAQNIETEIPGAQGSGLNGRSVFTARVRDGVAAFDITGPWR